MSHVPRFRYDVEARALTGVRKVDRVGRPARDDGERDDLLPDRAREVDDGELLADPSTWTARSGGKWKKTSDGMVKPSEVKAYIERNVQQLLE